MAQFFGFEIRRKAQDQQEEKQPVFAPEIKDDGALVVAAGGVYGTYVDLEGAVKTEAELVTRYREMAQHAEVDAAVDDITNEAIVFDDAAKTVEINLEDVKLSSNIKKLITDEFNQVLSLFNFTNQAHDLFKRWYVDGRLYYQIVIDTDNPRDGIKEMRYLDPKKIRKVREVKKKKQPGVPVPVAHTAVEYYIYNDKGFNASSATPMSGSSTTAQGIKIAKDGIVHVTSGLLDPTGAAVVSYLHKAIKPLNQLRTLEDATVIYRISRAPERRIFYIDVGNLPKMKAEQYLRDMMTRHKNKIVYDSQTGELRDDRKFMTMLEDYWLPRREGSKGTEITTLPAGQNLGQMEDVEYFQKKLYRSLHVPETRLNSENTFNLGQEGEISRDEIKFSKFIERLRMRFNHLFIKTLEKQLVLKGVMTQDEWKEIVDSIRFTYSTDNHFEELKESQVLRQRAQTLQLLDPYVGRYYSHTWIRKNVLRQTEADIKQADQEIADEETVDQFQPQEVKNAQQMGGPGGPPQGGGPFQPSSPQDQ